MKYKLPNQILNIARQKTGLAIECIFLFGDSDLFPKYRDLAMTDGYRIILSRKMLTIPIENQIAVIAHEIAHCILMQMDIEHTEREADNYASYLIDHQINYDHHDIQTIGFGVPVRPNHLPK